MKDKFQISNEEVKWAFDYLLSRANNPYSDRELKQQPISRSSVIAAIEQLEKTCSGKLVLEKFHGALRQKRRRSRKQSLTLELSKDIIEKIEDIARKNKLSITDTVTTSIIELHKLQEFHVKKIKYLKAQHAKKMTKQKKATLGYQERLKEAISIIEENLENTLIKELITSKTPRLAGEELKNAENEVANILRSKMSHALKHIYLAAKVPALELDPELNLID